MSGGSTLYTATRPQTGASVVSVVQNKESSHFVSQMSSTEALGLINNNNNNHRDNNINIEDAIRAISRADQNKTSQSPTGEMLEDSEFKPRIFSKFWSVGGAKTENQKSDKVWKTQREQRAESEIIAKQRKRDDVEDESLIQKLRRRQKISY